MPLVLNITDCQVNIHCREAAQEAGEIAGMLAEFEAPESLAVSDFLRRLMTWGLNNPQAIMKAVADVQAFVEVARDPSSATAVWGAFNPVGAFVAAVYDIGSVSTDDVSILESRFHERAIGDRLKKLLELYEAIKPYLPIIIGIIGQLDTQQASVQPKTPQLNTPN